MSRGRQKHERNKQVVEAYKGGKTLRECAAMFKVTFQRIHAIIKEYSPEILRTDEWDTAPDEGA